MPQKNRLTVMFFFAGDTNLSPVVVSQVKAIKDAGYQKDTDVLIHFDSNEWGAPTRFYHVNRDRRGRRRATNIGDGEDPYVRNMMEDMLESSTLDSWPGPSSVAAGRARRRSDKVDAVEALEKFLRRCREYHPAEHYMLFLLGHGLVVGNDTFMPDEDTGTAIKLVELGEKLRDFSEEVRGDGGAFELLALNSCSMSSIEVAYELKDTANYLMASQGLSYVGSWPYRQLLKKIFNAVEGGKGSRSRKPALGSPEHIEKLYYLAMYNAIDFQLAGYSQDLSLINLRGDFEGFRGAFGNLVAELKECLADERGKELILLAHLESQSYWQEDYTDLYDFCFCLSRRCDKLDALQGVKRACDEVIMTLKTVNGPNRFDRLVVQSNNFGSRYQYSHGLSIYFPWTEPIDDGPVSGARARNAKRPGAGASGPLGRYRDYAFTREFREGSWLDFLKDYFEKTKRCNREEEARRGGCVAGDKRSSGNDQAGSSNGEGGGALDGRGGKTTFSTGKTTFSTGLNCSCPTIKNYRTQELTTKRGKHKQWRDELKDGRRKRRK